MAVQFVEVAGVERYHWDPDTGMGAIDWRALAPPQDAHLKALDDHFLGARLVGPLLPWWDKFGSDEEAKGSPGSVHAVVAEALAPWSDVGPALTNNTNVTLSRPINFHVVAQVCMKGGLPPCKDVPGSLFQWEPQHDFRPLRHLMAWRRWGWPSDRFVFECALGRVLAEPSLYDGKSGNQRHYGWDLLLLAESLATPLCAGVAAITAAIQKILDVLWSKKGSNFITLNLVAGKDHGYLPICSWQHAVLVRALGRLLRRGWPDPRVATLYKIGILGLDAMRQPGTFTWVKDWDPASGQTMPSETLYGGTSTWTASTYAESLDLVKANSADRAVYLGQFVAHSSALKYDKNHPSNYDAAAHALITARLAA